MKKVLSFISFWGGAAGALLIALALPISGWAYIPFILSNLASIYLLKDSDAPKAIMYQIILFLFINILGIFRWLL